MQASWSTWKFAYDVQWVKFMDNVLNMVVTTDGERSIARSSQKSRKALRTEQHRSSISIGELDRPFSAFAASDWKGDSDLRRNHR